MRRLYYWRRGRAHNANKLYVVFNRELSEGIRAHIAPDAGGSWKWYMKKPFYQHTGNEPTRDAARKKIEDMIAWEFRPEISY